ncbi:DNA repair protein RAD51 homolog 4 isoform X1 [Punica granatum]|uniref:DNA repair protein RAD51 homolog 4 isoform X1 n=1 Tax=Punica granatum TaxID=22663 RepID=A0A6P8E903_PUNGR|nr:DNA repair protein RAD51 homolog 4 isoform X1 [Punica granatum]
MPFIYLHLHVGGARHCRVKARFIRWSPVTIYSVKKGHRIPSSFCSAVEDFLLHDLHALAAHAEEQPSSERLRQGVDQVFAIIDTIHQPWINGMELLEDAQKNKRALSTGCERIDSLLNGGLHEGHVTELAGPSSSGKTQLCLLAAANVAYQHKGGVTYVDTGNSFSPKRIAHFIGQVDQKVLRTVMNSIVCHRVYDIFTLLAMLHELEFRRKSQMCKGDGGVSLLIIDSISSLITPILGSNSPQGRALMISTGSLLKKLAHEYNIAVLVTNHTVGGNRGTIKPALGESWKTIPHTRLLFFRVCGSNTCDVSILKHPYVASGKAAKFTIHD